MSDYRRLRIPGGSYFFTLALYDRRSAVLTDAPVRAALRKAIMETRRTRPWSIDAWVLLPDHLHCIWTLPAGDADYSTRWSAIKRLASNGAGLPRAGQTDERRRESGLWQRRFWERAIRDDDDLARHIDYIYWNPVKHGVVPCVADWPYSTFGRYVERGL